ncbi:MAG TPA: TspO/MBR family protein [Actinomycetaceae bacterium]|nr:TspO/MBR family protein [Actinomycetaceae bacterium]
MANHLRTGVGTTLATALTATAGSLATEPDSAWYRGIRKPEWQPPSLAFPIVWTALYAGIAYASASTIVASREDGDDDEALRFKRALALNLGLNAGWSFTFFRAHNPPLAAAVAAALALSSADLKRRAWKVRRKNGLLLAPYAAWTSFATVLSAEIARLNA